MVCGIFWTECHQLQVPLNAPHDPDRHISGILRIYTYFVCSLSVYLSVCMYACVFVCVCLFVYVLLVYWCVFVYPSSVMV